MSFFNFFYTVKTTLKQDTPLLLETISHPENYIKAQRQSHISHPPEKYLYATPTPKTASHSKVGDLKMFSMLDIYKKYSSEHNNLKFFCIGYGIRKGLATQNKSLSHLY